MNRLSHHRRNEGFRHDHDRSQAQDSDNRADPYSILFLVFHGSSFLVKIDCIIPINEELFCFYVHMQEVKKAPGWRPGAAGITFLVLRE